MDVIVKEQKKLFCHNEIIENYNYYHRFETKFKFDNIFKKLRILSNQQQIFNHYNNNIEIC